MAYTPTNWKDGDVVTSARMNHIESGIVDANQKLFMFGINNSGMTFSFDKTFDELMTAVNTGYIPVGVWDDEYDIIYYYLMDVENDTMYFQGLNYYFELDFSNEPIRHVLYKIPPFDPMQDADKVLTVTSQGMKWVMPS